MITDDVVMLVDAAWILNLFVFLVPFVLKSMVHAKYVRGLSVGACPCYSPCCYHNLEMILFVMPLC